MVIKEVEEIVLAFVCFGSALQVVAYGAMVLNFRVVGHDVCSSHRHNVASTTN